MAIQSLLSFVNGICSTVSNGVTAFLTINYFVGRTIVSILTSAFDQLQVLVTSLAIGIYILLEDFSIFLLETFESIFAGFEVVTGAFDALIFGVSFTVAAVKSCVLRCLTDVGQFADDVAGSVTGALQSLTDFFHLLGASLLLLIGIVPKTFNLVCTEAANFTYSIISLISSSWTNAASTIHQAPVESFIGLIAAVLISFSTFKLVRHLVQHHNLTWRWLAQMSLKLLCFVYLHFCLFLIGVGTGVARSVEFTLTHLHVPRFHHAGDAGDDEDERNDDVSVNDNSDGVTSSAL
jgi:hypothetical protein